MTTSQRATRGAQKLLIRLERTNERLVIELHQIGRLVLRRLVIAISLIGLPRGIRLRRLHCKKEAA